MTSLFWKNLILWFFCTGGTGWQTLRRPLEACSDPSRKEEWSSLPLIWSVSCFSRVERISWKAKNGRTSSTFKLPLSSLKLVTTSRSSTGSSWKSMRKPTKSRSNKASMLGSEGSRTFCQKRGSSSEIIQRIKRKQTRQFMPISRRCLKVSQKSAILSYGRGRTKSACSSPLSCTTSRASRGMRRWSRR